MERYTKKAVNLRINSPTEKCLAENAATEFHEDSVSYYRKIYCEDLDCITNAITDHYDQQDFQMSIKLENLLIKIVKGDDLYAEYVDVLSIYCKDFDDSRFQVQLETPSAFRKELGIISVCTIVEVLRNHKVRSHLMEVIKLTKLILVIPVTNSTSERSF